MSTFYFDDNELVQGFDYDGRFGFNALTAEPTFLKICSNGPVDASISPLFYFEPQYSNAVLFHRDADGYETYVLAVRT